MIDASVPKGERGGKKSAENEAFDIIECNIQSSCVVFDPVRGTSSCVLLLRSEPMGERRCRAGGSAQEAPAAGPLPGGAAAQPAGHQGGHQGGQQGGHRGGHPGGHPGEQPQRRSAGELHLEDGKACSTPIHWPFPAN